MGRREPPRLPYDLRLLAKKAATSASERTALRDGVQRFTGSADDTKVMFRRDLANALVGEGWEPREARRFAETAKGVPSGIRQMAIRGDSRLEAALTTAPWWKWASVRSYQLPLKAFKQLLKTLKWLAEHLPESD